MHGMETILLCERLSSVPVQSTCTVQRAAARGQSSGRWREGGRKTASDDDSPENEGESSRLSGTGTHRAAATWPLPSYPPLHLPLRHQPCIS